MSATYSLFARLSLRSPIRPAAAYASTSAFVPACVFASVSASRFSTWQLPSASPSRPYVVWAILAANVLVFVLWRTYGGTRNERWMVDNFTVSLRSLSAGRLHTLITSAFSQADIMHLLFNCFALYVFGTELYVYLGATRFLLVYFGGAVTSSLAHVVYENYIRPRLARPQQRNAYPAWQYGPAAAQRRASYDRPAMGASGSAMSCTTLYACLFPYAQLMLYGIIPIPAWAAASGLIALDAFSAWKAADNDHTAHFGHLGVSTQRPQQPTARRRNGVALR